MCGKCYLQLIQAHPSKDLGQTWKTWFSDAVVIPGRNSFVEGFIGAQTRKNSHMETTNQIQMHKTLENAVHFPTCLYDWLRLKYRNFPTKITLAKTVTEANAHFCHNLKIWCFIFAWVQMISLLVSWETLICVASQHRTIVTWTPFNYYLICWAWNCCYPFAAHIDSVAKMRLSFQKAGFLGANLTVTMAALRQMLVTLAISSLWAINKQTHAQSTESYLVLHITRNMIWWWMIV